MRRRPVSEVEGGPVASGEPIRRDDASHGVHATISEVEAQAALSELIASDRCAAPVGWGDMTRPDEPIRPMTLGNMRQNGVRGLFVI